MKNVISNVLTIAGSVILVLFLILMIVGVLVNADVLSSRRQTLTIHMDKRALDSLANYDFDAEIAKLEALRAKLKADEAKLEAQYEQSLKDIDTKRK